MGRSSACLLSSHASPCRHADMPLQRHELRWVPVPEGAHDAAGVDAVLAARAGGGGGFERLDALPLEPSKPLLHISTATRSLRARSLSFTLFVRVHVWKSCPYRSQPCLCPLTQVDTFSRCIPTTQVHACYSGRHLLLECTSAPQARICYLSARLLPRGARLFPCSLYRRGRLFMLIRTRRYCSISPNDRCGYVALFDTFAVHKVETFCCLYS